MKAQETNKADFPKFQDDSFNNRRTKRQAKPNLLGRRRRDSLKMLSAFADRLEKNCWSRGVTRCSDAWDGELNACDRRRSKWSAFSCQMFQVGVSYLFDAICSARHRLLCEIYASSKTRAPAGAQMLCVPARPWILRRRSFARSAPSCVRV